MIRMKKNIDERVLEQYGFRKEVSRTGFRSCVYYHVFFENFQSVDVYITPFVDAWGGTIYQAREVVADPNAFKCDKAVDLIVKLVLEGIFEYVESKVKANGKRKR